MPEPEVGEGRFDQKTPIPVSQHARVPFLQQPNEQCYGDAEQDYGQVAVEECMRFWHAEPDPSCWFQVDDC